MISVRSAISRSIIGGRGTPNAAAALLQANVPFLPSSSSDERKTNDNKALMASVGNIAYARRFSTPADGEHPVKGDKPAIHAFETGIQKPSIFVARDMGKTFSEYENEPLVVIAEMGNHAARMEVLIRHVMAVDNVEHEKACKIVDEIATKNLEGMNTAALPHKIGVFVAVAAGIGAFPMVFDVDIAMWFNHRFVTMEIPPPSDLDTALETGAWTWNWMEPLIGTASFTLLCFQFARQNLVNLGIKPYTERLIESRSKKLYEAFPKYDKNMLHSFVKAESLSKD